MRIRNGNVEVSVDRDEVWFETPTITSVLDELGYLLEASRERPRPWSALPVLWGDHGVGKTGLARRFCRQARGAVSCRLGCPGTCSPARSLQLNVDAGSPESARFYKEPDPDLHDERRIPTLDRVRSGPRSSEGPNGRRSPTTGPALSSTSP